MKRILFPILLAAIWLTACSSANDPIRIQGQAQGTYYSIIYYDSQHRNLQTQIDSLLNQFDLTASLWVDSSIISRVNSNADTIVNEMFYDLLIKSYALNEYTEGAFNCKIGTLVRRYGFGINNREDITDAQIDSLLTLIQQDQSVCETINDSTFVVRHKTPEIEYDFNAIAQGYSVDMLAHMFNELGIHSYLIDVGGEVIAKGTKPNGDNWSVGIERPAENKYDAQEVEVAINLRNKSVVTSGNYRKYYEKDGVRYSHTIDPATGRPVNHTLLSASVVSHESWYADAMATAFMVMGLDKALQFINDHSDNPDILAAYFIYDDNGELKTYATPQFQKLIKQ